MKKSTIRYLVFLALVIGALVGGYLTTHAQTIPSVGQKPPTIAVQGYPGNDQTVVLHFPSTAPSNLTATVSYIGTPASLIAGRQPTVSVSGSDATLVFPMPRQATDWTGWLEIGWNGQTRLNGRVVVNRNAVAGTPRSNTLTIGTAPNSQTISIGAGAADAGQLSEISRQVAADTAFFNAQQTLFQAATSGAYDVAAGADTKAQSALTGVASVSASITSTSAVASNALSMAQSATTTAASALTGVAANNAAITARLNYVTSSGLFSTATADVVQFDNASWERKAGTVTTATAGYGGLIFPGPTGFYYERRFSGFVYVSDMGAIPDDGVDDGPAIRGAISYASTRNIRDVLFGGGEYLAGSISAAGQVVLFSIPSNISLVGTNNTIIKALTGSFTVSDVTSNRLIINSGRVSAGNTNIAIRGISFDCNAANQSSNAINGIYLERVNGVTIRNVSVKNTLGTGSATASGLIETFGIATRYCIDGSIMDCFVRADAGILSSSGISSIRDVDINYTNCKADGLRAMGFTNFYSTNLSYINCTGINCQKNTFNEENSFDVSYINCKAGIETVKAVSTGDDLLVPFTVNQARAGYTSPFLNASRAYGFYLLNTSGGSRIQLINCTARNFAESGKEHSGIGIRGCPVATTVASVTGTNIIINDALFTPFMVGRLISVAGALREITAYVSATEVTLSTAVGASAGNALNILGPHIDITGGDYSGNNISIRFDEDAALTQYGPRTVRVSRSTVVLPIKFNTGQLTAIGPMGPNNRYSLGFGMPVDANQSGSNQPTVPASGSNVNNTFPFDCIVYITGGTSVTASVSNQNVASTSQFGAVTQNVVLVPAGGKIRLDYTSAPTWQWWAN